MKEPTVLAHFTAYFSNTFETNAHLDAQRRLITSRPHHYCKTDNAVFTTLSTVKPKSLNNSGAGADSPKRSMPTTAAH
jgi:hypothetical protein